MEETTNIPEQQETVEQPVQQDVNWEARYKGSVTKINELQAVIKDLKAQLETKSSEVEQLRNQLNASKAEADALIEQQSKKSSDLLAELEKIKQENSTLKAFRAKIDVVKELGRPELMRIIDRVPDLEDREALKTIMQDFASFVDDVVRKREEELTSGLIPRGDAISPKSATPRSQESWIEYINSLPLGSIERTKALDDYGVWLEKHYANERS